MSLAHLALGDASDLPIKHVGEVKNGKVRSVYEIPAAESKRLIDQMDWAVPIDTGLLAMIISDRISAYDVNWHGEDGLKGIPGKGASLNATSLHWFKSFREGGVAPNHIVATPHPLVWIVQKAEPAILVEGIQRGYITGSMWRDYENGIRKFCGIDLPEGLKRDQKLERPIFTPTTKGVMKGIHGIPEKDDVNISLDQIKANLQAFGFELLEHVDVYKELVRQGFRIMTDEAERIGQLPADTKFELGYIYDPRGKRVLGFIDEVGTLDSSRYWDSEEYKKGKAVESSKEYFRQHLLDRFGRQKTDVLLNKERMPERAPLASKYSVPTDVMMETARIYTSMAELLTGAPVPKVERPREEIMEAMGSLGLAN